MLFDIFFVMTNPPARPLVVTYTGQSPPGPPPVNIPVMVLGFIKRKKRLVPHTCIKYELNQASSDYDSVVSGCFIHSIKLLNIS